MEQNQNNGNMTEKKKNLRNRRPLEELPPSEIEPNPPISVENILANFQQDGNEQPGRRVYSEDWYTDIVDRVQVIYERIEPVIDLHANIVAFFDRAPQIVLSEEETRRKSDSTAIIAILYRIRYDLHKITEIAYNCALGNADENLRMDLHEQVLHMYERCNFYAVTPFILN